MHKEIFNDSQTGLLPLMATFRREYYLVGGTAIALFLGHRRSIDFDMFKYSPINHKRNLDKIKGFGHPVQVTRNVSEQMNLIVDNVKITFFQYPFKIVPQHSLEKVFKLPSLIQLAAMKAYALGRRSKWKDYVDMYFLLRDHFSIGDISECAETLFGELYSEKLFRAQLCYFDDIDYSEEIDFLIEKDGRVLPIEVKSGRDYKMHKSLDNLLEKEQQKISEAVVLSTNNLEVRGSVLYCPIYMTSMLRHEPIPSDRIDIQLF